jgi:hypothetical protein
MTKLYNEMRIQNIRKTVNDGQRSEAKDDNSREHVVLKEASEREVIGYDALSYLPKPVSGFWREVDDILRILACGQRSTPMQARRRGEKGEIP